MLLVMNQYRSPFGAGGDDDNAAYTEMTMNGIVVLNC
jgi:hypothetical protein